MGQKSSKSGPLVELQAVLIGNHDVGKSSMISSLLGEKVRDNSPSSWAYDEPATVSTEKYSCLIYDVPDRGRKYQKTKFRFDIIVLTTLQCHEFNSFIH